MEEVNVRLEGIEAKINTKINNVIVKISDLKKPTSSWNLKGYRYNAFKENISKEN